MEEMTMEIVKELMKAVAENTEGAAEITEAVAAIMKVAMRITMTAKEITEVEVGITEAAVGDMRGAGEEVTSEAEEVDTAEDMTEDTMGVRRHLEREATRPGHPLRDMKVGVPRLPDMTAETRTMERGRILILLPAEEIPTPRGLLLPGGATRAAAAPLPGSTAAVAAADPGMRST